MTAKSLIAKKENDKVESGVQIRPNDPASPNPLQLWVSTSGKKMKYYNGMVEELFHGYSESDSSSNMVNVPATNIDWSLGHIYQKQELAGPTNFTFTNIEEGKAIVFIAIADTYSPAVVNLPVTVKKGPTDNFNLPEGVGIAIELVCINSVVFAKTLFRGDIAKFPTGAMGDVVVAAGQTLNVTGGSILDYKSLTIEAGGVLEITGRTIATPTVLGVKNSLIVEGIIRANDISVNGGNFTIVTPNLETITHTITQASGGAGGTGARDGATSGQAGWGGAGTGGYGGGGGGGGGTEGRQGGPGGSGGGPGSPASPAQGAGDNRGWGNVTLGHGGNGNNRSNPAGNGGFGGDGGGSGGGGSAGGHGGRQAGGGGGGYKGLHGRGLYIFCTGPITGAGQIDLSGRNGFNGGNAAGGVGGGNGGGGGAGAGGSGGYLWVRSPSPFSVPYTVSKGVGGVGGARAPGPANVQSGQAGQAGVDGYFNYSPNAE